MTRCGDLMVSVLDSGSSGPGSSRGRDNVLCSWARHFTPTVPLSTKVYKWGGTLRWTNIPSRGDWKYSLSLHATETGDKDQPDESCDSYADFTFTTETIKTQMQARIKYGFL